jgi:hypothetical protein
VRSRQAELLVQEHRPNTSATSSRVARRFARQPRLTAGLLVVALAAIVLGHAADGLHAQPAARDPLTWLGRIEGSGAVGPTALLGGRALVGVGSQVYAFDLDDAERNVMGDLARLRLGGTVRRLEPAGDVVVAAVGTGQVVVLDALLAVPPTARATLDLRAPIDDLAFADGRLAAAIRVTDGAVMKMIDLSNPEAPRTAGAVALGLRSVTRLRASGRWAAALGEQQDGTTMLVVIDIGDPLAPAVMGRLALATDANWHDLAMQGTHAYVDATSFAANSVLERRVSVIDLSDLRQPRLFGAVEETSTCRVSVQGRHLLVSGGRLVVASYCFLDSYNLTDPAHPTWSATLPWFVFAPNRNPIALAGNADRVGVVMDDSNYLVVNARTAQRLGEAALPVDAFNSLGVAARGSYLFVARSYELDVFDVTVPTRPAKVASLAHPTVPTLASEFARENWMRLDGSLLFLAGSPPVIIDVADPRAPRLVSVFANAVSASAVAVAGSRAYVVQHSVLQIFDIADPSAPVLLGEEIGGSESPISMAVDGTDVLLWRMLGGVLLDASDPSAIRRKAQFRLAMDREYCEQDEVRQRRSIAYRGQRAYVTCGRNLGIIDFTRPPTTTDNGLPSYTESGLFETQQFATHVILLGDRVLLTDLQYLYVLDARDPEHIVELARFEHTVASDIDQGYGVAMSAAAGNRVYVSSDRYGPGSGHVDILEIDLPRPVGMVFMPWLGRQAGR